jgi:hypothetical protein
MEKTIHETHSRQSVDNCPRSHLPGSFLLNGFRGCLPLSAQLDQRRQALRTAIGLETNFTKRSKPKLLTQTRDAKAESPAGPMDTRTYRASPPEAPQRSK